LLITDGYSTEPMQDVSERLIRQRVPLDFRLTAPPDAADYRVQNFSLPPRAQLNEPFLIEVEVAGEPSGTVPLTIWRDGQKIGATDVPIRAGRGSARFTDRLAGAGAHKYTARVNPAEDARP